MGTGFLCSDDENICILKTMARAPYIFEYTRNNYIVYCHWVNISWHVNYISIKLLIKICFWVKQYVGHDFILYHLCYFLFKRFSCRILIFRVWQYFSSSFKHFLLEINRTSKYWSENWNLCPGMLIQ